MGRNSDKQSGMGIAIIKATKELLRQTNENKR